jgi:hypothetical protein
VRDYRAARRSRRIRIRQHFQDGTTKSPGRRRDRALRASAGKATHPHEFREIDADAYLISTATNLSREHRGRYDRVLTRSVDKVVGDRCPPPILPRKAMFHNTGNGWCAAGEPHFRRKIPIVTATARFPPNL